MSTLWRQIWDDHSELFITGDWQECPGEKIKAWRLPLKYSYYSGGNTTLRAGIIASDTVVREDDFLLAGLMWGNRVSNGAKTVLYFIAPNYSPFFLQTITKIGGNLTARAVYWRERLSPSLYLIPEKTTSSIEHFLGEERPDWEHWSRGLNPVARQQAEIIRDFFENLQDRKVRIEVKPQSVLFTWGDFEIAEVIRKGKKFELLSKTKWEKNPEKSARWQKVGWVDFNDQLNPEFRETIFEILEHLESVEKSNRLNNLERLRLLLRQGRGIIPSLWGEPWEWPWLPKDRSELWTAELGHWFYFQGNTQLSVVQPILERPLYNASLSLILTSVLENSMLLKDAKDLSGQVLRWDQRIQWLTTQENSEELRRVQCWLKKPEQFPIWVLPKDWRTSGLSRLVNRINIRIEEAE